MITNLSLRSSEKRRGQYGQKEQPTRQDGRLLIMSHPVAECSIESGMGLTRRKHFLWKLRTRTLELGARTAIMGVLNVTPDSFSDGGLYLDTSRAIEHGLRMVEQGATVLDIGGESTRPSSTCTVTASEELDRVLPVIEGILRIKPETLLSIDTYKAATAAACLQAGAEVVNDVSGLLWDESMAALCARTRCGVVLMHTRGKPDEWHSLPALAAESVLPMVMRELGERRDSALSMGLAAENLVLDPGYGFGKRFEENYSLMAQQDALHSLGLPLLVGVSRKSFLRRTLGRRLNNPMREANLDLITASTAAATAAVLAGAHLIRVHDVEATAAAVAIADELLAADQNHAE